MRSLVTADSTVGLLLFDEPSAALDPVAENGTHFAFFFQHLEGWLIDHVK